MATIEEEVRKIFEGEGEEPGKSEEFKGTAEHIRMVPPSIMALQEEIRRHPELMELVKSCKTFSEAIGESAAFAGIMLHGEYTYDDLDALCGVIRDKLVKKRGPEQLIQLP